MASEHRPGLVVRGADGNLDVPAGGLAIGRAPEADVRVDDRLVSRHHARISPDGEGGLVLEDLRSTNGTFVNGARIEGRRPLQPGDRIEIGGTVLRVEGAAQGDATVAIPAMGGATDPAAAPGVDAAAILEEAKRLYAAGDQTGAEAAFRALLPFEAHAAEGHYGVGLVRLNRGELDDASEAFHRSLDRAPSHANAHYQLGVIAERRGRPDDAVAHHRRALEANPAHAGAKKALARLGATPAPTAPVGPPAPDPEAGTDADVENASGVLGFGVYEYLRNDKSPLSKQALGAMEAVRVDTRPYVAAYLGQLLVRAAIFVAIAALAAALTRVERIDLPGSTVLVLDIPAWAPAVVLVAATIPILWRLAVILTSRIRIDKGRLQLERGILTRTTTNLELWRVTDVDLVQGFWNRLTGDGTIELTAYQEKKPIKVTGLARGAELRETYQQILNLAFLLRSNPIVKGIIT